VLLLAVKIYIFSCLFPDFFLWIYTIAQAELILKQFNRPKDAYVKGKGLQKGRENISLPF
jgi:hypothetical protein